MKILMVLTSHDKLGDTGRKTGFWLEEFAGPHYTFRDAGADVVSASPKGGQPPIDPMSTEPDYQTEFTRRFDADAAAKAQLAATVRLDSVSPADFDTVFYSGGHGPLWDLAEDRAFDRPDRVISGSRQAGRPRVPRTGRAPSRQSPERPAVALLANSGFSSSVDVILAQLPSST